MHQDNIVKVVGLVVILAFAAFATCNVATNYSGCQQELTTEE